VPRESGDNSELRDAGEDGVTAGVIGVPGADFTATSPSFGSGFNPSSFLCVADNGGNLNFSLVERRPTIAKTIKITAIVAAVQIVSSR